MSMFGQSPPQMGPPNAFYKVSNQDVASFYGKQKGER